MGLKQIASRLIKQHGQTATLLRPGPGTPDGFGGTTPGADVPYAVTVLSAAYAIELQLVAAALLAVGDQRLFVSVDGLSIEPATSDKLEIDGTEFEVHRVTPLAPAGDVLFWELQVRHV